MYNLLVTAEKGAWDKAEYVLPSDRYLEHTDQSVSERLKALSDARKELMTLPTLFAYESPLNEDAHVGWIQSIQRRDNAVRITFEFDRAFEPVPSATIESLMWDLEIGNWEMNRTHWAVKEADLLAVLDGGSRVTRRKQVPPYATKGSAVVADIDAIVELADERDLEVVARAVRDAIERNEPANGLDRLHTFTTKLLRSLCEQRGVTTEREKPLHSLFGSYVKKLRDAGQIESEMTERILKSSISIMESFNDVRNNRSLAHDNELLNHNEASLVFHHVINTLRFVKELEGQLRRHERSVTTKAKRTTTKRH